jgi:hypothetical protein
MIPAAVRPTPRKPIPVPGLFLLKMKMTLAMKLPIAMRRITMRAIQRKIPWWHYMA